MGLATAHPRPNITATTGPLACVGLPRGGRIDPWAFIQAQIAAAETRA